MTVNDYIDIAKKVTGQTPDGPPTVDHSSAASVGLDMAKRQAEAPKPEQKPLPSLGSMPIAN